MHRFELKVMRLHSKATAPDYAHDGDAGLDLYSCDHAIIDVGAVKVVGTGIAVELPVDTEAQVRPRSGLAATRGVTVLNSPGTIDAGYRGELKVILINLGGEPFTVTVGMKIAQLVVCPIIRVDVKLTATLSNSPRGGAGFGSTG